MSFYFRDIPRFGDRLHDKSGDELLQKMKKRINKDNCFPDSKLRPSRDSFERHASAIPKGFPFDDDSSFASRPNDSIRAHLDDLASRHPEFAEHLLGPPWGDVPFQGSLLRCGRPRRRGSGSSGSQGHQSHVDEDTGSQASGSSAASGASAVSSHSGEVESVPQYGLRNTMDLGQQQHDMQNPEKNMRNHRSMSAPPENRQQQRAEQLSQQQSQLPSNQNQRFVSRVDITPQHNQQQRTESPKPSPSSSSSPPPPPPPPPSSSNVRHIPIFVEGRDEPVISKIVNETPFSSQRHPSPPRFHRPSHFNDHFASKQQWPQKHFQHAFYEPADFEQPIRHHQQFQQHQQQPQQYPSQQQQQQPQQYPPQQQQEQEIPKPKPSIPKDPLERVAQVQKDVDDLAEQVRYYVGGSRQDKEYVYLDEMLTRELIKLDDIETEGRENVRQARRNAIKSIQDTISLLETKVPLGGQQQLQEGDSVKKSQLEAVPDIESMEVDPKRERQKRQEEREKKHEKQDKQNKEPIPLPPAPSSPTKTKASSENENVERITESANQNNTIINQDTEGKNRDIEQINIDAEQKIDTSTRDKMPYVEETTAKTKSNDDDIGEMTGETSIARKQTIEEKLIEGDGQQIESPKLQKKKTMKQYPLPVSEEAIPLPPPPSESAK